MEEEKKEATVVEIAEKPVESQPPADNPNSPDDQKQFMAALVQTLNAHTQAISALNSVVNNMGIQIANLSHRISQGGRR